MPRVAASLSSINHNLTSLTLRTEARAGLVLACLGVVGDAAGQIPCGCVVFRLPRGARTFFGAALMGGPSILHILTPMSKGLLSGVTFERKLRLFSSLEAFLYAFYLLLDDTKDLLEV